MSNTARRSVRILRRIFRIYCAALLVLLFARPQAASDASYREQLAANRNLIPFRSISVYLYLLIHRPSGALISYACTNLFGNLLLFLPFGLLLPGLRHQMRSYPRLILVSAGIVFLLELIQLFSLLGSFDVDDLILNLIGVSLGYLIFRLIPRKGNTPP